MCIKSYTYKNHKKIFLRGGKSNQKADNLIFDQKFQYFFQNDTEQTSLRVCAEQDFKIRILNKNF